MKIIRPAVVATLLLFTPQWQVAVQNASTKQISVEENRNKVYGSWLGQGIGNVYGLAHVRPDPLRGH